MSADTGRKALAELVGTALLLVAVVGSGSAAERLSPGDVGLQLFENAAATAAALVAIILAVGPVSAPTSTRWSRRPIACSAASANRDVTAQVSGGVLGVVVANLMFSKPLWPGRAKPRRRGPGAGRVGARPSRS